MKKIFLTVVALLLTWGNAGLKAQETVTNAFDDLKRTGTVNEQDSEMRQAASNDALQELLAQNRRQAIFALPKTGCMISVSIKPFRPVGRNRAFDTWQQVEGDCQPGEFYTWQIGLFTPFKELKDVSVAFSDLVNADGNKIKSSSFQCFNQGGTDTNGQTFRKNVCIPKGHVQALWIGWTFLYLPKGYIKERRS